LDQPPQEPADEIVVARVNRPHGRDGALSIELLSDLPGRFDAGRELILDGAPRSIIASRQTGPDSALLWLEGVSSRHQATPLSGKYLSAAPDDQATLEEGEYFHYQLIGLNVHTEEGEDLGELREILETGSNDVYIVRGPSGEVLIPATQRVVLEVDLAAGVMRVDLPDGLR
jgi:16S rRNA processing protein RimM